MKKNNPPAHEEDFASMLEKSFTGPGKLSSGQLLETTILSISKDTVFIQLSGKSEGLVARDEFLDAEGELTVKVGDALRVFYVESKNGEARFTTRISGDKAGSTMLEQAYQNRIPVDGLVEKEIKGGYEVKIGDTRAFCPYSQMGPRRAESASEYIGKRLSFRITEYKEGGRRLLVSNRILHEEAHQAKLEQLKKTLSVGQVVKAPIISLHDFGAFVDLEGLQALLPVSEIGRTRVADIRSVLSIGQEIEASILKLDWSNEKITLSMKSLTADPWDQAAATYTEESRHSGKVVRVAEYGAFVNLEPGIDGLIHASLIRANSKFGNSKELSVKVGQTIEVEVLSVDRANRRISLKPANTLEQDETTSKYLDSSTNSDTYNPFAALLNKNKKGS